VASDPSRATRDTGREMSDSIRGTRDPLRESGDSTRLTSDSSGLASDSSWLASGPSRVTSDSAWATRAPDRPRRDAAEVTTASRRVAKDSPRATRPAPGRSRPVAGPPQGEGEPCRTKPGSGAPRRGELERTRSGPREESGAASAGCGRPGPSVVASEHPLTRRKEPRHRKVPLRVFPVAPGCGRGRRWGRREYRPAMESGRCRLMLRSLQHKAAGLGIRAAAGAGVEGVERGRLLVRPRMPPIATVRICQSRFLTRSATPRW
jgi:hypothetical protein